MEMKQFTGIIGGRVAALQDAHLRRREAGTGALLAALRHAVGQPPGMSPEIWSITIDGLPHGTSDIPTPEEQSCHDALTLFALHLQSRSDPMHVPKRPLGAAVRMLARTSGAGDADREKAVRRRFDAAATSTTYGEMVYHLRGLVSQLRSAGIGLDYGMLANDLLLAQRRGGIASVRLRWARSYYQGDPATQAGEPVSVDGDNPRPIREEAS